MFEKIVDQRYCRGYKAFYPESFFIAPNDPDFDRLATDYIDHTMTVKDAAKKWLYQTIEKFNEFCSDNDYYCVGIIPWKLFEVCYMPCFKDSQFMDYMRPHLIEVMEIVNELRDYSEEEKRAALDELYPPKVKRTRRALVRPPSPTPMPAEKINNSISYDEDFGW